MHRQRFVGENSMVLQGYELEVPKAHVKLNTPMMPNTNGASVFDWFFDKTSAEWRLWSSSVPAATIQDDAKFSDIFIPTVDSVRYTFLLDLAVRHHQPFLFVGPTGEALDQTRVSSNVTYTARQVPMYIL